MGFKIGDKVEAIRDSLCSYKIGEKGKVIATYNDGMIDIRFDRGEIISYCTDSNFKLAGEEKKYIIYDKTANKYDNVVRTKEECLELIKGWNDNNEYELLEVSKRIPVIKKTIYTLEGE